MPQYDDRDIVEAIRNLRDTLAEINDYLFGEAKEDKKEKLKKLGNHIKHIRLARR